jgi:CheY-like chemotaxis protein
VIVNDILDFSKIESGKIALENIQFSLHKVLEQVMKTMVFKANEKGLKLQLTVQKDVPNKLMGDPYRLNQILMNLTGNALKFTRDGGIYIDASVSELTATSCHLKVTVRDTGIGIPESKLDKVFESFTQAYTDTTRLFGGSGLGLAISRNLARILEGDITVSSKVGKGSVFTLEIPFNRAAEDADSATDEILPETPDKADLSKYRFLLVEDNLMNQFVAIQILKRWKARVEAAENGEIALQMLKKNHYDLVYMDLQMPVMSGYEATTRIRAGEAGGHNVQIPILAMTADALHETKLRVLETGMDDFITKPLELDDLFSKTVAALKASKHGIELRA